MTLRILIVRPEPAGLDHGGDEVLFRHTVRWMEKRYELETFHVRRVGRLAQLVETLKGAPGEVGAFISRENADRLDQVLASGRFDMVFFFNEVTGAYQPCAWKARVPCVFISHNTQSMVARSDPSLLGRMITPLAIKFERRFYGDQRSILVCISQLDQAALPQIGIDRPDIILSPPGAPPSVPLRDDAELLPEAVLTGSYGWWRKRRDVKAFARDPSPTFTLRVSDPIAEQALASSGLHLEPLPDAWDQLRFGLITDRFLGGFKLKSLEYVAKNCIIVSLADISSEFRGLPFAEEFVRHVRDRREAAELITGTASSPERLDRFRAFKSACLQRFDWDVCLAPLEGAVELALARGKA